MEQTQKQKMLAGRLYHAGDPEIQADQKSAKVWMASYNAALGDTPLKRGELLRERLGFVGNGAVIRRPFHCDFGYNISLGSDVFLNFNCVILDVVAVSISAGTSDRTCGSNCTADHPRDPAVQRSGEKFIILSPTKSERRRPTVLSEGAYCLSFVAENFTTSPSEGRARVCVVDFSFKSTAALISPACPCNSNEVSA